MGLLVNKKISAGFAAALAFAIVTGAALLRIPLKQSQANRWVEHTHQVLTHLETTLSTMKDAETGQRGYLLTGDKRYLEPYNAAISKIDGQIQYLKKLTADNPNQQRRIAFLERHITEKLSELKETIDLRQKKGFEAAWQVVLSGEGKQKMDDIRQAIAEMENEENQLLERRTKQSQASAQSTIEVFSILILLNLALICLIYYLVNSALAERQQAEAALRQSQERFCRAVLDSPFPLMIHAEGGEVVQINHTWKELTGYDYADIPTIADWTEKAYGQRREFVRAYIDKLYELNGKVKEGEYAIVTRNGGTRVWDFSSVPLGKLPDGRRLVLSMAVDVSDRKQAEQQIKELNQDLERRVIERTAQLEAANKELEAFSYSVSHDLRAPLRSIDGFSQALLERYTEQLGDKGKHYLERVRAATQRMGQLIDDLLTLSRVSKSEMHLQTVNLTALVQAIAADLQQTQPELQVKFVIATCLVAHADRRLLKVVFENLLNNAWKFTSKKVDARIEFGTLLQPDGVTAYFIRDNGAGFDMAYADKLFGAFQRLHALDEFPGTGIGLATVQRIIHRHGGRVWAEGAVEEGATFYFTL